MKFTNKYKLPEGIYNAVVNDLYDKGEADYSATEIINPPQLNRLRKIHFHELVVDISDEMWKLFGAAVHYILERGSEKKVQVETDEEIHDIVGKVATIMDNPFTDFEALPLLRNTVQPKSESINPFVVREERIYATIGGIRISGKPDWYDSLEGVIDDYKVTQVYKVTKTDHKDWIEQGNIYGWLFAENGEEVNTFRIVAIMKDWKPSEKARAKEEDNYPDTQVKVLSFALWKPLERARFVLDRVEKHEQVKNITDPKILAETAPCSPEERWHQSDSYAVKKKGSSRATSGGVFSDKGEALKFLEAKGEEYELEERIGKDVRCENWCPVSKFCYQFKVNQELKHGKGDIQLPDLDEPTEPVKGGILDQIPVNTTKTLFDMTTEEADVEVIGLGSKEDAPTKTTSEPIIEGSPMDDPEPAKELSITEQIKRNLAKKQQEKQETVDKHREEVQQLSEKYDKIQKDAIAHVEAKYSDKQDDVKQLEADIDDILEGL